MRWFATGLIFLLAVGAIGGRALAQEWDDQAVDDAIKAAKAYLWSRWSEGHWPPEPAPRPGRRLARDDHGGRTALCLYALLAAGENHQDARVKKTLEWLASAKMRGTYAVSLRANVWSMLGTSSKYRRNLITDVNYLVKGVDANGAYDYIPRGRGRRTEEGAGRYDNSNSQLAVLGVWAGARNAVEVPRAYWKKVEKHWLGDQQTDGGWCYQRTGTSYGSMSVAGLASLFICLDAARGSEFILAKGNASNPPIERGLAWLDEHFSPAANPRKGASHYYYYLYGVERVGLASGYKYFGKKDWYKLGAKALLDKQSEGGWGGPVNSAFALLFLARGQHPVLFNKLKYSGTWNTRPRDLANLTRWISGKFERPVNWQIIHMGVPVAEWHDAPILYVSGASAPKLSGKDIDKLREYVLQGGVILSEAAGDKIPFTMAMRRIYAKMFPDYELKRLGDDHPIYKIQFKIPADAKSLEGISNGVRLLAIHSPRQLSLPWQINAVKTQTSAFALGANIYFFVTDKGSLRRRGVSHWPKAQEFVPVEKLKVAIVKHAGNYQPEPLAWKRFAILMGNRHQVEVTVSDPTPPAGLDASRWPVAAMTGTTEFSLSDEQRKALAAYLSGGGTLIVDAAGGSKPFADAARKEFADLLSDAEEGPIALSHPIFTKVGPTITKATFRRTSMLAARPPSRPRIRAIIHKGRIAVIFSRDDLTVGLLGYPCWGLKGYSPESSFEIMRNLLLYASGKTIRPKPAR